MKNEIRTILLTGIAVASLSAPLQAQETGLVFYGIQMEELEYRVGEGEDRTAVWNGDAYVGTDELKLRWLGQGEYNTATDTLERMENRFVLQKPVSDFFDVKAGVRLDTPDGPDRWFGVIGVTGLAKQWFEIDADLFLSETGDASARLDIEYELLLTNRLILTPSADTDIAFSEDRETGVGSGVNNVEVGLRLSYDLVDRTVSPYLGIVYERKFGDTAKFAKAEGEDAAAWFAVIGTRFMF
ncbi:MAG: copper resistance protein B [Alphaproteobacteria bacterium]